MKHWNIIFKQKTMNKREKLIIRSIDEWFHLLSKREKLIVLAIHNEGYAEDFQDVRNVELVLMSGIPPIRRYEENGVPCADYPSFDEIKDSDLITIWNSLSIEERQMLFSAHCKNLC
jgi:hypothetical protein